MSLDRRFTLCLATVGALVVLTGCQAQHGPIEFGRADGGSTGVCAPAVSRPWLIGDAFQTGDYALQVDALSLVNPDGIELIDSWLTTPDGAIGAVEFPPPTDVDWQHAVPAVGAIVSANTLQSFAVEVQAKGGDSGHADAIAIDYTVDGQHYQAIGTHSITLADPCP